MAEQIDPNVALEKVSKAIRAGQKQYDKLPQEVKDAAKIAAEGSLGSDDEYSPTEKIEREDYKGFETPVGMTPEKEAAWRASIDESLGATAMKAVGSPIPSFGREKAADAPLFQDLKTGEDFARLGLEAASMSPIGQAAQAAADVGITGMDIAAGDYTGAAISGAAVLLPFVSAGVLKSLMRHAPDRTKALEDAFTAGDISEDVLKEELKQLQLSTIGLPLDELDPSKANKPLRSVIERQQRNLRGTRFVETAHDFSPKYGLEDTGGLKFGMRKAGEPVQQLGPLTKNDRDLLQKVGSGETLPGGKTYDEMSDIELRELRDEYVAYGYDDFEGPPGSPLGWDFPSERVPYHVPYGGMTYREVAEYHRPTVDFLESRGVSVDLSDPKVLKLMDTYTDGIIDSNDLIARLSHPGIKALSEK